MRSLSFLKLILLTHFFSSDPRITINFHNPANVQYENFDDGDEMAEPQQLRAMLGQLGMNGPLDPQQLEMIMRAMAGTSPFQIK